MAIIIKCHITHLVVAPISEATETTISERQKFDLLLSYEFKSLQN